MWTPGAAAIRCGSTEHGRTAGQAMPRANNESDLRGCRKQSSKSLIEFAERLDESRGLSDRITPTLLDCQATGIRLLLRKRGKHGLRQFAYFIAEFSMR